MALPDRPTTPWLTETSLPGTSFVDQEHEYQLYTDDDELVLSVEMPGFDPEEITVSWDDGVLDIAAEHQASDRPHRRTYHHRFRFHKEIDEDGIEAEFNNGILEVRLPVAEDEAPRGTQIEVQT